ncbi:bifunctional phosphopantothenoylcysteine decarboxylase/phosphopantothenate--cysteine ligase CoaBC [Alicyclobacillus sp.]|uniref:bifunctional phosphopantothenoylcysteine decarboxylase/phosphopantothenate--cysteine ligase CoaBC n=1 Tax=Alicyclobacillus sp. TaxID=61169 RepID=UPI0025B8920C|nr:bifunctional phosphopantothenoylcysteine decarboxylase/phosphopantothenate--cysteine ligase CoaBC [Alicyclobacillus sp.]MCL6515416.1 bifunctional phosphopantothenoylcysteine decarboxylase/phosphopantothenate--cysteine ligase CoaBC [Alicyclobacillus sp.]
MREVFSEREEGSVVPGNILVGVGGGIAAFKAAALCSLLVKRGHSVQVLMTKNATRFVQPLTFQALTHRAVVTDTFEEPDPSEIAHIALADAADVYLIAPATANLIAKLAHGIADDMVTTTALACTAPLMVAPAMNVHMWAHPTVQENLTILRRRGIHVVEPDSGILACGYTGKGRLAEPEELADAVERTLARRRDLAGVRVVVTAGPTVEDIDPVRFLSNASSGKMGYAIAEAAVARGATVELISGPVSLDPVAGAALTPIRSTQDLLDAVLARIDQADVFIAAAAPADFRPVERLPHKWKKTEGTPVLALEPTPDVLAAASARRRPGQVFVGFAAETRDAVAYGREKLRRKNLDLVVVNDVTEPGAGFGVDTNRVVILDDSGAAEELPLMAKRDVADRVLDRVADRLRANRER